MQPVVLLVTRVTLVEMDRTEVTE
jgi:hypothetical protein